MLTDEEGDDESAPHYHHNRNRPSSVRSGPRKRGSSDVTGHGPITRLRNSSINSAQSEAVQSNYEDDVEYQRTSTNFGSRTGGKTGTPVHSSHRPRMGVFTK